MTDPTVALKFQGGMLLEVLGTMLMLDGFMNFALCLIFLPQYRFS